VAALCARPLAAAPEAGARLLLPPGDALAAQLAETVGPLVEAHFPRLLGRKIRLVRFHSSDAYFRTDVRKRDAFRRPGVRTYNLYFDPRLLDDPPPAEAVEAILAHELVHLADYTEMSGFRLLRVGARYLSSRSFRIRFERRTDVGALRRGKAAGLKAYRQWIYPRLDPEELEEKRVTYFTPEEIDDWVDDDASSLP
jgi:hypothetical protein